MVFKATVLDRRGVVLRAELYFAGNVKGPISYSGPGRFHQQIKGFHILDRLCRSEDESLLRELINDELLLLN